MLLLKTKNKNKNKIQFYNILVKINFYNKKINSSCKIKIKNKIDIKSDIVMY